MKTILELSKEVSEIADALWSTNALRGRQLHGVASALQSIAMGESRDTSPNNETIEEAITGRAPKDADLDIAKQFHQRLTAHATSEPGKLWWASVGLPRELAAVLAEVRQQAMLAEHRSHMDFDCELYATLVDPVAEGTVKEAEMREQLLVSARWYRQHVHDLETQINKLVAHEQIDTGE